jgi:gluconokinase
MKSREGHFMKADMLKSQLDTLEALGPNEPGQVYDISLPAVEIVAKVLADN